jgi:O-antigen ligase
VLGRLGVGVGSTVIVVAPIAAGGVHRASMILLMLACALALAFVGLGASRQRPLRTTIAVVLPLVLLVIPLLQSIPLPMALRGLFDPAGNALLVENDITTLHAWPLSLDPPLTRENIGRAAAALAIFMIAYHWAAGQTKRHLVIRLVAGTGVAAAVIGLGHRALGFGQIYGLFTANPRSLLAGPFVNANHTAEFLELGAFACVACALQRDNMLNRYGWLTGMIICAAGTLATLSRGGLVGLLVGTPVFLLLVRRSQRGEGPPQRRVVTFALGAGVLVLVAGMAALLGAGGLLERFKDRSVAGNARLQLWRDGMHVLAAHPAGIGRGAFNHLYPVYRTLVNHAFPITFAYLENHPLQLLVDSGWPLFLAIVAAVVVAIREIVRRGRHDRIEAALLGGLFAVTAHSFMDFGLETLGVALPFAAILGTVMGRSRAAEETSLSKRATWAIAGLAFASLLFGAAATAHSSDDDFDKLLKHASTVEESRAILLRAQEVHPTDYFYAFSYARTEPIKPTEGRSPRLHALNRALRLCPECAQIHIEVARTLWKIRMRSQSLIEWRAALRIEPPLLEPTMEELWHGGAKPAEVAALASDAAKMVEVADFFAAKNQLANALSILDEADLVGAPREESLLTRCRLQTRLGQLAAAETTLAEARAAGIQDPRMGVLEANLILANQGAPGAAEALSILDLAATRYPLDVPVQELRASIVLTYGKWQAADRAIDGYKLALYRSAGQAIDANLIAARIRAKLGQWTACFSEYRLALAQAGGNTGIWAEFGQTAETAGRDSTAREAYAEAARLAPSDQQIAAALRRVDARQGSLRSAAGLPPAGR